MKRALVLGGGVAGIAAAFGLRDRGYAVRLLEAHSWLGGRAFSPPAKGDGARPDNGPHVMLGCYEHMRALLRRLGTEAEFGAGEGLCLEYQSVGGPRLRLELAAMSPNLALPLALLKFPAFSLWEKLKICLGLPATYLAGKNRSLERWLQRYRQGTQIRAYLWDPLCRAIMNAEASQVDAGVFFKTLRRAFGGSAADAAIWLPRKPWSELIGEPAFDVLSAAGVEVSLGRRVAALQFEDGQLSGIDLAGGDSLRLESGEIVFSALPWHVLARLIPGGLPAAAIASSAILSVYCQTAERQGIPASPLLVLVDGEPFHFFCRRVAAPLGEFALLAAGAESLRGKSVDAICAIARDQLQRYFPDLPADADIKMQVLREDRATMIVAPGDERHRPPPGLLEGFTNFYLCGDWTATGLPSTLESAAESATRAIADLR